MRADCFSCWRNPRMNHSCLRIVTAVVSVLVCLVAPSRAWSQAPTGTLSGVVVDQVGAVVPDVAVVVVDGATALKRESKTDAEGTFTFPLLPAGTYTLRATRLGFTPFEVPAVVLTVTDPVVLRVQLKVEGISEAVMVTAAQKRGEESLKDVPVAVAVLAPDALASAQNTRIRDYYLAVPGLNAAPQVGGAQSLSIRGVTTGGLGIPTVGFLIDDIPLGSTAGFGGSLVPDIDPGNLSRIEVLRGPQGTLYGARAVGGLINYITEKPSTAAAFGRIEAGGSAVDGGGQPGLSVRGLVNLPVNDRTAVQASGFVRGEPGYVDNNLANERDVNSSHGLGGRAALLFEPSSSLSVKFAALFENIKADGSADVFRSLLPDGFRQAYVNGAGFSKRKTELYSTHINAKLGFADLTSITSLNRFAFSAVWDRSPNFSSFAQQQYGVAGAVAAPYFATKKITQEVRLNKGGSSRFQWLLGGFFTDEDMTQIS